MKSFDEFKSIAYKGAVPHTVYSQGKSKQIPKGKAVPLRSRSSAGGNGDGGGGDGGE
jgi:hypothetical protein